VMAFALEPGESVCQEKPTDLVVHLLSASLPIDHPPQL
jgi:hypothetical protein